VSKLAERAEGALPASAARRAETADRQTAVIVAMRRATARAAGRSSPS